MLRSIQWAALGTGFTFLMTTLGAAVVFFLTGEPKPRFQKTALGFAAGVMTAASVWSLLLPAIDQAAEAAGFPGGYRQRRGCWQALYFWRRWTPCCPILDGNGRRRHGGRTHC